MAPPYPHGTPSWVELNTPDQDAAAAFYGELFGWVAGEPSVEAGGYQMFLQDDAPVAGLMKLTAEGQPSGWMTYVSVDSADDTAAKAGEAGGQVLFGPMDVMDIGRMAMLADPAGGMLGLWEAKSFGGAEFVNVPVSLVWNELLTREKDAALAFYPAVFGWKSAVMSVGSSADYTVWERPDGRPMGGITEIDGESPAIDGPARWAVTFAVADTDAIVAQATELGASVDEAPTDAPWGRFASLRDPQGAAFSVITAAQG